MPTAAALRLLDQWHPARTVCSILAGSLQGLRLDIEHASIGANRQTQTRGIDPQVQIVAARGIKATGCEGLRKDLQALRAKRTGRGKGSEGAAVHAAGDVGGGNVVTRAISKRIDGGKVGEQVHFGAAAA